MFKPTISTSITTDRVKDIEKSLRELSSLDVLVGVPQENSSHKGHITNPELAFIHTHGVRSKAMRQEMGKNMEMGSNGLPYTPDFERFSENLSKGMNYSAAYNLYLHEHGSPAWQIPPRPIIEPAIEDPQNKKIITDDLGEAGKAALDGNMTQARAELQKAGMDAQNAVREWFVNPRNEWPPNAESTIREKGSDRPLIDTAELRKSITYVIREKGVNP